MDVVELLSRRAVRSLERLASTLRAGNLPFAVIGASALLMHRVRLPRTTRDLDLAVTVRGGLDAARAILLEAGFSDTRIPHRFTTEDSDEIDILAVDPSHEPAHEIILSDGERIEAIGLPEAVQHAVPMALGSSRLPVAPLPLLIAIKLWTAASDTRPHDLADACASMEAYELSGTRRFDIDHERLDGLTFETSGAFLAGLDVVDLAAPATRSSILDGIDRLIATEPLSKHAADGPWRRALVWAYRLGIATAARSTRHTSESPRTPRSPRMHSGTTE